MISRTKRQLTSNELDDILSVIEGPKCFPDTMRSHLTKGYRIQYRNELAKIKIYPAKISELKRRLQWRHEISMISPGETVGVLCGQSKGQVLTQSVLNSFHSTGMSIAAVNVGLPRFKELLIATSNPKIITSTVYFKSPYTSIQEIRQHTEKIFKFVKLQDVIKRKKIIKNKQPEEWYADYDLLYNTSNTPGYKTCEWCLVIKLKPEVLFEYKIRLIQIQKAIESMYQDIHVLFSPQSIGEIHIYFDKSVLAVAEEDDELIEDFISEEFYYNQLRYVNLSGIHKIEKVYFLKDEHYKNPEKKESWIIMTKGSNLEKVMGLSIVDYTKTVCDDMWEIYDLLGVEAARSFLKNEFTKVVSSDGTYISEKHINLLVDSMCYSGTIHSISRYGIKREQVGPLAKISFEECLENLVLSGIYGETDNLKGVSASVMCGKQGSYGTGMIDQFFDLNKMEQMEKERKQSLKLQPISEEEEIVEV